MFSLKICASKWNIRFASFGVGVGVGVCVYSGRVEMGKLGLSVTWWPGGVRWPDADSLEVNLLFCRGSDVCPRAACSWGFWAGCPLPATRLTCAPAAGRVAHLRQQLHTPRVLLPLWLCVCVCVCACGCPSPQWYLKAYVCECAKCHEPPTNRDAAATRFRAAAPPPHPPSMDLLLLQTPDTSQGPRASSPGFPENSKSPLLESHQNQQVFSLTPSTHPTATTLATLHFGH